ncbi:hypothetical protein [Vibrio litoralis]|uniref:hypothetical protein n=1 Tax=Vibrio litoralis TaxID=335972 RepID=UPI0004181948|nr:hypothetical protein [Vibrio litoralis]
MRQSGPYQTTLASCIDYAMYQQFGIFINPFSECSDIRDQIGRRYQLAKMAVALKFKGTHQLEQQICH